MRVGTSIVLSLFLLVSSAWAQEVFEVRRPRDPGAIEEMQRVLYSHWDKCRDAAYPQDVEAGAAKASSLVEVRPASKGRVQGKLKIEFYALDGAELPATKAQKKFVQCVRNRFEARLYRARGKGGRLEFRKGESNRWSLANSFGSSPAVRDGVLGRSAAVRYISDVLGKARGVCRVDKETRIEIHVGIGANGLADEVTPSGGTPSQRKCLRRRLEKKLRFPKTDAATTILVKD